MRVNTPMVIVLPSSFYLFISSSLSGKQRFKLLDGLHLIPFVFFIIYLMPFYVLSVDEKVALYEKYLQGHRVDSLPVATIYRVAQFAALVGIIVQLAKREVKDWSMKVWVISVAYLLLWALDLSRYFGLGDRYAKYDGYYLISFLLLVVYQELTGAFDKKNIKYTTSGMSKHKTEELALKTHHLIESEKLFKSPKLTLADLASKLDVHHNYISQAINSHFGISFKELINSQRVEEAKDLLLHEENDRLTFEAIAEMAGFNSVSSFNASFKKIVGETPSAFKKRSLGS
ncbi:MAG: helix-turn-helix domain-containing protein [Ekhidna sp.]